MRASICLWLTPVLLFLCSCNFSYLPKKNDLRAPELHVLQEVVVEKIKVDKSSKHKNKEEITVSKFSKGTLNLEFTTRFSCGQFDTVNSLFTHSTCWITLKNKLQDSSAVCKESCFYDVKLTASGLTEKPKKILVNYHEIGKTNKTAIKRPGSAVKIASKF